MKWGANSLWIGGSLVALALGRGDLRAAGSRSPIR